MNHFDEMICLLYLEGQLEKDRAREVSEHAATCSSCRDLLRAMETEGVWLREALGAEEESIPARLMEAPERGSAPWGWISALALAAGGAYTLWSGLIEPWQAQAEQAGFTQGNLLTMLFFSGTFWKGWDAMRSLMEFMAVAILGVFVIWLLRKRLRGFTAIAVVMGSLLCALVLPPPASAADVRHGNPNFTLPSGQEVKTDLIVFADTTRIDGDVDGDLIAWSRNVTVNGHVKGDVLGWGADVRVNGTVDGNVRTMAQTATINGSVGRNFMAWAGEADIEEKGSVGGSVTLGTGNSTLGGKIGGDVLAFGGNFELNGLFGRDIFIHSDRLTIESTAEIKGPTKYEGHHEAEVAAGAKLASPVEFTLLKHGPDYTQLSYYWHQTLLWGASFVFGLVVLFLAPGFFFDAQDACKKILPAAGFGILFLIATPIVSILIWFTIVGIGVGISTLLLYVVAIYSTQVFVGGWLGEKVLGPSTGITPAVGRLALGLGILRVLRMVPYLRVAVLLIVIVWGMGALVLALYKRIRPQLAAAPAV
jgi:cytoskeletal protein CcmA (bactofilin family)